ncbi:triple tyrosine motif-containing protein [Flavobacterium sp.]|uniref:triple tyrosine motif-containing protein n=1 Tax=Flavobacterium sp. TaxID=239 RepID=UPI0022C90B77|nr:triple tyrosine motif-containing protein [Flavobacterium sp.]MCZ8227727.1 triple tyrosine motif-containing protein [Flavobacterium sp.]
MMNNFQKKTYSFVLLFFISMLFAQVKNIGLPDIKNYTRADYKGGTQNWNIDQDKNGNLYFANNNGLFQFDGTTWRNYKMSNADAIRCLKIDPSGKIYVGGYNEFGYFEPNEKGKLVYRSLTYLVPKTKIKTIDFVWKIHLFNKGVVFQGFSKAFYLKNNTVQTINAPKRFQFSFLVNGRLYLQDIANGLLEYKNNTLYTLPGTKQLNTTEVWSIIPLPNQKLLICTLNKGLFTYSNGLLQPWNTETNAFVKKNSSLGGIAIKNKFIVINTVLNGIIVCDTNGKIIQHINHKKGLQNNTVLTSFIDNKNNIWLGLDNGIAFVNENSPFTYFGFSYDISTVYASIVYNQNLYVATNRGVFYHSWNQNFKEDVFKLVEGTTGQSWNIQVIDNQLLCGNNNGAMVIQGDRVHQILDTKGYFGFKKIPGKGNFMIGSNYNGFALFEKKGSNWMYRHQISGFDHSSIFFEIDPETIWLKKDGLLYQMTLSQDLKSYAKIKIHKVIMQRYSGIGSIQRINNKVYFQTKNHFFKYSNEQEQFYEDKTLSKLFQKIPLVNLVYEDQLGNIWYTYGQGLGMLQKQNNRYHNCVAPFSNLTGELVSDYLSINAIDKKNVFIGLTDGLAHYNPEQANSFVTIPKAFIRNFSFQKDTLLLGNGQETTTKYTLPYSSNHVQFSFSSPTYENLDNVEFSYQLDGFDEKWSPWSRMFTKEYTNLSEGSYVMKVKVRNSYGVQSKEATIRFIVMPPWYRHFFAYLLYLIAAIAAILYVQKTVKAKIRKNKYYETIEQRRLYLEKESKIRQEQYLLEKEIEKLKNDQLKIKILAKDKELVNNSLQVVKKNKTLNGIIHKLKEINHDNLDDTLKTQFTKLQKSIVKEVHSDKSWKDLEKHIKNVHFDFLKRLKDQYPTITPRELDLATYLLMNMSTKEIAEIMNISNGGVELARYRLRKKLELNKKENLIGFLMKI